MHHLTRLSLAYPKTMLVILLVITAVLAAGLPRVYIENDAMEDPTCLFVRR